MYAQVVKRSDTTPEDDGDLSIDLQEDIATEIALQAAVDMVVFMVRMWNELVEYVEKSGVSIEFADEAKKSYLEINRRLRASLIVVRDAGGVDTTTDTTDEMEGFS